MRYCFAALFFFLATVAVIPIVAAEPTIFKVDRSFYPNYPSLLKWDNSVDFTPPKTCADCHPQQYKEWSGSVHNLAFTDPIYQGELNKAVKAVGHKITKQCEGCHSPAGMLTGEIKGAGLKGLSPMALAGVSCDICHSVSGTTQCQTPSHEPENGSLILSPGIVTKDGKKVPVKRGPYPPEKNCGGGFHTCIQEKFYQQADLCASCHQIYHFDSHFPLESTYNEWKHGPYAQLDILCQDCHMVDYEVFKRTADTYMKPERKDYRHYFNGANYLLTYLSAGAARKSGNSQIADSLMQQYDMAIKRLKSAAELEVTPIYQGRELVEIKVRVSNIRAGHNLPTSLNNVRQMWLEVTATDDKGNIFLSSGTMTPDGVLPDNTRMFNAEGMGKDYHYAIDPWLITSFARNETIPAKGYKDVYYGIKAPPKVESINLNIRLRYRQADQNLAESLLSAVPGDINLAEQYGLSAVPQLPIVDMVVKDLKVPAAK